MCCPILQKMVCTAPNLTQKKFCIPDFQMDLSFQRKKQFAKPLHDLQVTTNLVIEENSGVFFETPCTRDDKLTNITKDDMY